MVGVCWVFNGGKIAWDRIEAVELVVSTRWVVMSQITESHSNGVQDETLRLFLLVTKRSGWWRSRMREAGLRSGCGDARERSSGTYLLPNRRIPVLHGYRSSNTAPLAIRWQDPAVY